MPYHFVISDHFVALGFLKYNLTEAFDQLQSERVRGELEVFSSVEPGFQLGVSISALKGLVLILLGGPKSSLIVREVILCFPLTVNSP